MAPMLSGLSLLMNDMTIKSIDVVEGCTRLVQILGKLDEAGSGIQISQESSPVADIRGMVYRLRIGTIFEAVVDTKGEKCAVFSGWGDDGAPHWKDLDSPVLAQAVLQAVNIREGKSLPAFVNLPLADREAQSEKITFYASFADNNGVDAGKAEKMQAIKEAERKELQSSLEKARDSLQTLLRSNTRSSSRPWK